MSASKIIAKKKKLLYIFSKPRDFANADKVPYIIFSGYDRFLKDPDFETSKLEIHKRNFWWLLWRPFEKFLSRNNMPGFSLGQLIPKIKFLNQFDIVFGANDSGGLPLAFLKKLGLVKSKVIFITAGLINKLENKQSTLAFKFFSWVLGGADLIVCWSPLEKETFKRLMPHTKTEFVLAEADTDFFKPVYYDRAEDYILAVGNDIERDIKILFKVAGALGIRVKLVANNKSLLKNAAPTNNIEIINNINTYSRFTDYEKLIDLYKKARLVILPLKEARRITGQFAFLEAISLGKAMITAKTAALTSAYPNLENNKHLVWYKPEDAEDLKTRISELYNNKEKIDFIAKNARAYAEKLPRNAFYLGMRDSIMKI